MKFASPVVVGCEKSEFNLNGKNKEYVDLPALAGTSAGIPIIFRLELDDEERKRVAAGDDILFVQLTGGTHFQPIQAHVKNKQMSDEELALFKEVYGIR